MFAQASLTASPGRLFDWSVVRVNPSPAAHGEDSFGFMNRVDQPFWERLRDELERWFAAYPREHAADLRGRFRDAAPGQHFGAWWELYLHRLFSRLGFEVEVHPELPEVPGRPDFRLVRGKESFLMEAAVTFSGIVDEERHGERENWIMVAIDRAENPNFFVRLQIERGGLERPSVREIVAPLERWLAGLDPDEVIASAPHAYPTLPLNVRDWSLTLTALPRKPTARGRPGRLLGIAPGMSGFVNDVEMLRATLRRKRRRYGKPNEPIVTAVLLTSPTFDNEDIEQALLGSLAVQVDPTAPMTGRMVRQRNGSWMPGSRPRGTRVSAVLTGTNVMPWTFAGTWPRIWPNPWARHPLSVELPFPTAAADQEGIVRYKEVTGTPAALLGVAEGWPGPEAPFAKE